MEFLSPLSLLWLGLLAPLVALYVLRRRRERRIVASTMLWAAAMRDLRAERPWQRLVPHVSLLLQAAILIGGALALARPIGDAQVPAGARVAVVVDTSASMDARDGDGASRLDRAKTMASSIASALPPGGEMMIVEASREPVVQVPATSDRATLELALRRLSIRGAGSDLAGAVALAGQRLEGAPAGSRVIVLTDGAMTGSVALEGAVPVEVRQIGEAVANHAIVALDVRARPEPDAPDAADVFVRLARFGEGSRDVRITASIEGGRLLTSRRVTLNAGAPRAIVLRANLPPDAAGQGTVVRAELEVLDGAAEAFVLDDIAVAPSPAARRLPVFLIGAPPRSVERVLLADRYVELFRTELNAIGDRPLDGLHVYSGATPQVPPPGPSLAIAPSTDTVFGVALGPSRSRPEIVSWEETEPLLRFVRFADVHLASVRPITDAAVRTLLTTDAGPAIAALTQVDAEATIVAFDPDDGDWPRQPGFVVFFHNVLERARQHRAAGSIEARGLGEPLRVRAPDGTEVRVVTPSGAERTARSRGGIAIVESAAEPGVSRVTIGDRERFALANLLDPEESDLAPRARFVHRGGAALGVTERPIEHREVWPWLALGVLIVLAIEAWWATRRRIA